jgi:hypothetical protein
VVVPVSIRNIAVEMTLMFSWMATTIIRGWVITNSLYSSRPDLAQQYNASLFEGGEGAANAARIRQETDQQRILFEQQQQAAREAARASQNIPQYQGGNIMGLMQYQPQQQQAPQQQAPQQGLLGGGLHRPGFVANPKDRLADANDDG